MHEDMSDYANAGSNILTFHLADWELGLLSWKEKGVAALQGEGGGVWVSLLLFGREKEERFPVVAVAATAVTQRRTGGRAAGNRLEGGRPSPPRPRSLRDFRFCLL